MLRRFRPSPAMVVALVALFVSLGGVGYAATKIGTAQLKNGAVTAKKLHTSAVTTKKLKNAAVKNSKIAGSAVQTGKIADSALATSKIADGAVVETKLGDGAVTGAKLADASVSSSKIAAGGLSLTSIAAWTDPGGNIGGATVPHNDCAIYNFGDAPASAQSSDVIVPQIEPAGTLLPTAGLTLNAVFYSNGSGGLGIEAGVCNLRSVGSVTLPNPFEIAFYGLR